MVKMCHNPMHLTNHRNQRQIRSVQTALIPILSQKRIKPTKKCLETVNTFLNVSMVKHLSQSKAFDKLYELEMDQECLDNTYTHFVPKEDKTNKNCLEAVNAFLSVSMVNNLSQSKAFDKLYELEMDQEFLDNSYTHFLSKEAKTNKKLLRGA